MFHIDFRGCLTLSLDDIWPDGNAPEHPTAQDVIEVMKASGSKTQMMQEWSLDDDLVVGVCSEDGNDRSSWS